MRSTVSKTGCAFEDPGIGVGAGGAATALPEPAREHQPLTIRERIEEYDSAAVRRPVGEFTVDAPEVGSIGANYPNALVLCIQEENVAAVPRERREDGRDVIGHREVLPLDRDERRWTGPLPRQGATARTQTDGREIEDAEIREALQPDYSHLKLAASFVGPEPV